MSPKPAISTTRSVFFWLFACLLLLIAPFAQAAFTINNDGTVTDPTTGLTWMRCAMGQTWNGSTCTGTASIYTFDQANALTGTVPFAGYNDWRVPNIRELQTIVDRTVYNPAINGPAFPNTLSSYFWSGSPYANSSSNAWVVYFDYGYANYYGRGNLYAVRLVRGGQSFGPLLGITRPTSDYVDNGNGTVTHIPTNLTWKRCAEGQTWTGSTCSGTVSSYTYDQAQALTGTAFAGKSDWRVPTEDELVSLMDYTIAYPGPTINTSIFPNASSNYFWSSSLVAGSSDSAWVILSDVGSASYGVRSGGGTLALRLVRGGQPSSSSAPVCTLSANPATINTGSSSTLTATCNPAASSYAWTGGVCSSASSTCTVTPTTTTTYTVTGANSSGTGAAASATVTVNTCSATLGANSTSAGAAASSGSVSVASTCTWTATSNASWITIPGWSVGATASSGSYIISYTVAANTSSTARTGTLTIAGQTYTVTQAGATGSATPVCTVSANPATILPGGTSTLTASCSPAATSYTWSGGTCAGNTGSTCTVAPTSSTYYTVAGTNSSGTGQAVGATVTVAGDRGSCAYALSATSSSISGAAGTGSVDVISFCAWSAKSNSTWITLAAGTGTAGTLGYYGTVSGTVQGYGTVSFLVETNPYTFSRWGSFSVADKTYYVNQAGSNCTYQLSARSTSAPVGESIGNTDVITFCAWSAKSNSTWITLAAGAGTAGTLGGGTVGYGTVSGTVIGNGSVSFALEDNPYTTPRTGSFSVEGTAYTVRQAGTQTSFPTYSVPGTLGDDVFVLTASNSYFGGAGDDTYIISPSTLSGAVTAKITDNEGNNIIQLAHGLTISSSTFFNNALQLKLSNGATVQVLGASTFTYQMGANASAGIAAANLTYAQFAAMLGVNVPAAGASGVGGHANFIVQYQ